jgi:hypothetical protein
VERKSRSGSHTDSVLLAAPDADGEIRRREVGTGGGGAGGRLIPDVSRASAEDHASPGAARSPCGCSGAALAGAVRYGVSVERDEEKREVTAADGVRHART